jgi:hypothetical protein
MHMVCPHCRNPIELVETAVPDEIFCPSCGSSFRLERQATTSLNPADGRRDLGRFQLLDIVGTGAFGTVALSRSQMARILRLIPADAWKRSAVHSQSGLLTLRQLVLQTVRHLRHHLRFIAENWAALGAVQP